jgi:sarcosine oxidase subunit beta
VVDVTPDGRPIQGLEGSEGLFLSVGWSGTGFKKAPALGAELARWVTAGAPRRDALSAYDLGRFERESVLR